MTEYGEGQSAGRGEARRHILQTLEHGGGPTLVAVSTAGTLAALAIARFAFFLHLLSPRQYGELSIYLTLVNILPFVCTIGLSLQFQRIARRSGPSSVQRLQRAGLRTTAVMFLPVWAISAAIASAFSAHPVLDGLLTTVQSSGVGISLFSASIILGSGRRALSTTLVFVSNAMLTAPLLLIPLVNRTTVTGVLSIWALASLLSGSLAHMVVGRYSPGEMPTPTEPESVSYREGVAALPMLLGPWLLVFCTRYILGLTQGTDAVAMISIASTVADMAFLVSAAIILPFSNRLMDGEMTSAKPMALAVASLVILTLIGSVLAGRLVAGVGQEGYSLSNTLIAIFACSGIARLYSTALRSRLIGIRKVPVASIAFLAVTIVLSALLLLLRPNDVIWYAIAMAVGSSVVAGVQAAVVARHHRVTATT